MASRTAGPRSLGKRLRVITRKLARDVGALGFAAPVTHVYNPLAYAGKSHELYLDLAQARPDAVLLGMNPGPWGMAQTGVPFGDPDQVREFLGIEAKVGRPAKEHPKRPVRGFASTRNEVSGQRLWGWAADRFKTPEQFFARFFIVNYCPLSFMEESSRNRTPDKLPPDEREPLFAICDAALRQFIEVLEPRSVIGIGAFAEKRAALVLGDLDIPIHRILHPSPASPLANRGWGKAVDKQLAAIGLG